VTLLRKEHDHHGLAAAIVPLVDDADAPVRKAALLTLGAMQSDDVGRLANWRLSDPVPYVRSAAIHALAQTGQRTPDRARRHAIAMAIAPSLADRDWSAPAMRLKDALLKEAVGAMYPKSLSYSTVQTPSRR
jgi:HEAT repeat protein